jgi:hypothetical protein
MTWRVRYTLDIYKNKREDKSRFITFWKNELPAVMYEVQKPLLYSLIIFLVAGVIGRGFGSV